MGENKVFGFDEIINLKVKRSHPAVRRTNMENERTSVLTNVH